MSTTQTSTVETATQPVDDILQSLTPEQFDKLKILWLKLDHLAGSGADPASQASPLATSATSDSGKNADIRREAEALQSKAFDKALADLTPEQLHTALWTMVKQDDPDTLVVRFLRARSWNVEKAAIMLIASMHWRLVAHVEDEILPAGDAEFVRMSQSDDPATRKRGEQILLQLRSGKSFARGTDHDGRPLLTIRVRLHKAGQQTLEALQQYIIFNSETSRMLLRGPNTTVAIIFDLTGFGMANMDWNALRLMASGLADNYPESLGQLFVYRAPWIVNGIWAAVRGWLDPAIASKVHFVKSPAELATLVDISQLPASMGGTSDWEYEYVEPAPTRPEPSADDVQAKAALAAERAAIVEQYEDWTRRWARGDVAHDEGLARRRALFAQLRANYWKGDRWTRGETLLDRVGVIGRDGSYDPLAWAPAA